MPWALMDGCRREECGAKYSLLLDAPAPAGDAEWKAKGSPARCLACGARHIVASDNPVLTLGPDDFELTLSNPERAVELVGEVDGKRISVWACSVCMLAAVSDQAAEQCCRPRLCSSCNGPIKRRYWMVCQECSNAEHERKKQARIAAATKVPVSDYGHHHVWHDDHEFMSVDDWLDLPDDERPELVFGCYDMGNPHLDATDILGGALSDYHDEALEDYDVDELQKLLDEWMKTQSSSCYHVDDKHVVFVPDCKSCWACGEGDPTSVDISGRCAACAFAAGRPWIPRREWYHFSGDDKNVHMLDPTGRPVCRKQAGDTFVPLTGFDDTPMPQCAGCQAIREMIMEPDSEAS